MGVLIRQLFLVLLLTFSGQAYADDNLRLAEQEIKSGLLYNFLKYTDWSHGDTKDDLPPIMVCVFGEDPFAGYLQPIATRTVNQQRIAIRVVHDALDAQNCHLLFVNANEKTQWPKLRNFLAKKKVLTVSDFKGFADAGGMIEFAHEDNHISVSLNIEAVTDTGLRVQDRLLKLVTVVHPVSQEGKQ